MTAQAQPKNATSRLVKRDPTTPAFIVTGRDTIVLKAGTVFAGTLHEDDETLLPLAGGYEPGADYAVVAHDHGTLGVVKLAAMPDDERCLGGFHFAPGGNATARAGGDDKPAINPCSVWDINFRPACPDPRGMTLVERAFTPVIAHEAPGGRFWSDIYLLGADHLDNGTSRFGVEIADGDSPPQNPAGKRFKKLDCDTAIAVMKHHGKGLLGIDEFFAGAFGVTEKTAHAGDPRITGLDAARTSKWGWMQATGNMWVWGHDGDPDLPRPSVLGGAWHGGGIAGSRYADVGYWPDDSGVDLGARGRGDHLQLG